MVDPGALATLHIAAATRREAPPVAERVSRPHDRLGHTPCARTTPETPGGARQELGRFS